MYEFLDRLISVALPRVRDFRGLSSRGFDKNGTYTLGIKEQIIFPEISIDKINKLTGMNITIVIDSKSPKESFELLKAFGMPFIIKLDIMAKNAVKVRELKRKKLVEKYAAKRKELKAKR